MIKLTVLLLASAFTEQTPAQLCESEAIAKWNRLSTTSSAYLERRSAGVRDAKLRVQMRKEFESVMSCECF